MNLFITNRTYQILIWIVVAFLVGYYYPVFYSITKVVFLLWIIVSFLELYLLFWSGGRVDVIRECQDRFSNGDQNSVLLKVSNTYGLRLELKIIDEVPKQFQLRDLYFTLKISSNSKEIIEYSLRPVTRGVFQFNNVNTYVYTGLGLFSRRFVTQSPKAVKVYPSFIKLHQYELMAISKRLFMHGHKRIRRVGNSQEFDNIKEYVIGDDPRHINWQATARRSTLMTNHFMDERSQHIYCLIDKSRSMKMPFEGMTLLDYSINAGLVMSDVALRKGDRAGLLTFENTPNSFLKASNRNTQLHQVMEMLYHQETSFMEPDYNSLYNFVRKNITQRSFLMLFTNFESIHSLERQISSLRMINRDHLLLVIYFRNTELDKLIAEEAKTTREIYNQAVAYQMIDEKRLIRESLNRAGILSLFTSPENLNVDVINKYIEVKTKRML